MNPNSVVVWNVMRLFDSGGSPIEHALSDGDAAAVADDAEVAEKVTTIAAAIDAMAELTGPPLFVGLVEIETDELAQRIARSVRSAPLGTVDDLGQDQAGFALDGLDISLLVNRDIVTSLPLVRSHVIDRSFNTRDILEVDATLRNGATVSVLVNHWPSRMISEAAGLRVAAAHYLGRLVAEKTRYSLREMWDPDRRLIDLPNADEMLARARHPLVVMGDFNDDVFNEAIEILGSTSDLDSARDDLTVRGRRKKQRFRAYVRSQPHLFNPLWEYVGRGGSYYRSPRWRTYDQIMLSRGLLEPGGDIRYLDSSASIFSAPDVVRADGSSWTLTNRNHKPIPFDLVKRRGCSDHFAVHLSVELSLDEPLPDR